MAKINTLTTCYHCGDDCDGSIVLNTHAFCCHGCKTVYEILDQNNLCNYYDFNQTPGTSLKNQVPTKRFEYLDDEEVKSKLLHFNDGNISTVTFYVPQIHCSSCIFLLENLYKLKDGIHRSVVNFMKREASISFDNTKLSLRNVVELMASIGYEPKINLNDLDRKEKKDHLKRYYLKIGIAFFCFGNMMLLSFPEYLGMDIIAESPFRKFFGYLNFLLALPVMFYSAQEFFFSALNALKQKSLNMDIPIALGIVAMFIRSSYEVFSHTGAGYFDTLGSLVLLMLIGRLFQNKTYDTLSFERDYKSYFPVAVTVVNNGKETSIPLTKLRIGDRLLVRNMELIPADAILLKGKASIDYSFVTGEATPVSKQSGDTIYAGGRHIGPTIQMEVTKEVSHSYLTRLWNDAAFRKDGNANITSLATRVSQWFTPAVIAIAAVACLYWWNKDMRLALNAFTSVLIITCPCALSLSSPFTLGNILRILSRNRIYLKNALVVEQLAKINTLVFDKTGTLTNTKQAEIEFVGVGEMGQGTSEEVKLSHAPCPMSLSNYELSLVKSLTYHSSHPLSRKVFDLLKEVEVIPTENFKETEGMGIEGWVDENCVRIGSKKYLLENQSSHVSSSGFNHASKVYVGINGEVKGYFLIKNEYRQGFGALIERLKRSFSIYVVSGDNDAEKNFLKQHVPESNLIFHQQPADKLEVIKGLQRKKHYVLMLGDGLNDAGALKQSDVGIAISDDVNNFSPACDGIIEAGQFSRLDSFISFAADGVSIIKASFIISLLYNVVGIYFAVQGTMSPLIAAVIMPISSATIILFTTIASNIAGKRRGF